MVARSERIISEQNGSNRPICKPVEKRNRVEDLRNGSEPWACSSAGSGTVTSVATGTGLVGGPITSSGTIGIDITKVPLLSAANTFTGNQTVNGNLSATGMVTGSAFQIGSELFDQGSYANRNAFLGFAGNSTMTGTFNTASGSAALVRNGTGIQNTASGANALFSNTTGSNNTADGENSLYNTTGSYNTATGQSALYWNSSGNNNTAIGFNSGNPPNGVATTGSNNTFIGYQANPGIVTNLSNATAIGANAQVMASNAMVLGSINGVNGATADTHVGIGTNSPGTLLEVSHVPPEGIGMDVVGISNSGGFDAASLVFYFGAPGYFEYLREGQNGTAGYLASSNYLYFITSDSGTPDTPSNPAMIIDPAGTVYTKGDLNVGGTLSKRSGSFKIDHPLDPANKYLYHSFVESPDMMNVYNGNVTTDKHGVAVVVLPEYFEALNRDFRYQLTVIGQFAEAIVAQEIHQHLFRIRTSRPGVKVSWQVTGIRHDAYADAHRIPVEEEKPPQERGRYLDPELFGASPELSVLNLPTGTREHGSGTSLLSEKR